MKKGWLLTFGVLWFAFVIFAHYMWIRPYLLSKGIDLEIRWAHSQRGLFALLVIPYIGITILFGRYFWLQDKVDHGIRVSTWDFPSWWNESNAKKMKFLRLILWIIALGGVYGSTESVWKTILIMVLVWLVASSINGWLMAKK